MLIEKGEGEDLACGCPRAADAASDFHCADEDDITPPPSALLTRFDTLPSQIHSNHPIPRMS